MEDLELTEEVGDYENLERIAYELSDFVELDEHEDYVLTLQDMSQFEDTFDTLSSVELEELNYLLASIVNERESNRTAYLQEELDRATKQTGSIQEYEFMCEVLKGKYSLHMHKDDYRIMVFDERLKNYFNVFGETIHKSLVAFTHNKRKHHYRFITIFSEGNDYLIPLGDILRETYDKIQIDKNKHNSLMHPRGVRVFENGDILNYKGFNPFTLDNDGYRMIYMKDKMARYAVHRLVAETFVENKYPDIRKHINHKDGNKLNNHFSNLEWCTNAENLKHAWETGLNTGNKNPNPNYKIPEKPETL